MKIFGFENLHSAFGSRLVVSSFDTEKKPISSEKELKKIILLIECKNGIMIYNSRTKEKISEFYKHENIMFAQVNAPSISKEKTNELNQKINIKCKDSHDFACKINEIFEINELHENLSDTYVYCVYEIKSKKLYIVKALYKEISVTQNATAIAFGETYYQDWIYQFLEKFDKTDDFKINKDVEEFAVEFENEMKRLMKIWDSTGYFNPIKLPLNIVTLKY